LALRAMRMGRPGPAALECGMDIWGQSARIAVQRPLRIPEPKIDSARAAKRLGGAGDSGAQDASEEVTVLSAMLQAPVLGYRRGRGVLDSHDPLSVTLHGAKPTCRRTAASQRQARFARRRNALAPGALAQAPRKTFAADRIPRRDPRRIAGGRHFVDEVTQVGFAARLLFPVYKPRTFLSPGYQDNLGWGFATALGAQDARPDAPVVAITGDGGFMYTATELATAMLHRIPLTTIVFNDGRQPADRQRACQSGFRRLCQELRRRGGAREHAGRIAPHPAARTGKSLRPERYRGPRRRHAKPVGVHFHGQDSRPVRPFGPGFRVLPPRAA
jgi:thiamine pyrophosphate-dependent acetolactate synthase large subunit-like protein